MATVKDFWICYLAVNPEFANEAAKLLMQFSSTYLCGPRLYKIEMDKWTIGHEHYYSCCQTFKKS